MLRLIPIRDDESRGDASSAAAFRVWVAREYEDPALELVRLLHEACEVEHALMIQYLYAAYSLRDEYADVVGTTPIPGSDSLLGIAIQEMQHLDQVNRLLVHLGGPPNLNRQDFPYELEIYPFEMTLERLSRASLAKYIYAEAPSGALDADALDGDRRRFAEEVLALLPKAQRVNHIGTLYRAVLALLDEPGATPGDASVIRGVVTRILEEGEHHFEFFKKVFLGTAGSLTGPNVWEDDRHPSYPSLPVPTNPTAIAGRPSFVTEPGLLLKTRLANVHYWIVLGLLRCRYLALSGTSPSQATADAYARVARRHMVEVLGPVARELAALGAGIPFDVTGITGSGWDDATGRAYLRRLVNEADALGRSIASRDPDFAARCREPLEETARSLRDVGIAPDAVVIGAGPAGLAAAVALGSRGLRVIVLERAHLIGGKVHSYAKDGRSFEHGVHGWWRNYLNFDRILSEASVDVSRALREAGGSNLVFQDGTRQRLGTSRWPLPSPLFLLWQILRNPLFSLRDAFGALRFGIHVLAFDHARDYSAYDRISFETFMDRVKVPRRLRDFFLTPFILSFDFAVPNRVSAACGLSGIQFYVLHDQESVLARWSRGLPATQVFDPLAHFIERHEGTILLNQGAERLVIRDGAVTGVEHLDATADSGTEESVVGTIAAADVPVDGFVRVDTAAGLVWVGRSAAGALVAFGAACSHQGCPVSWVAERTRFECPCHGGVYGRDGVPTDGPPLRPLGALEVREVEGRVEIVGGVRRATIVTDAVILATDLHAAHDVLAKSGEVPPHLLRDLAALDTTPVIVVRLWFEPGTLIPKGLQSAITPDARFLDNFFHLNEFDDVYDREGTLIEVQSYRVDDWLDQTDAAILDVVFADLAPICPAAERAKLKHASINRHRALFTLYAPGKADIRPHAESGIAGLHLAGDWTDSPWSVWMMERAVVSGLRAANRVLERKGKPAVEILRLPRENWLLRVSRAVSRGLRALVMAPLDR